MPPAFVVVNHVFCNFPIGFLETAELVPQVALTRQYPLERFNVSVHIRGVSRCPFMRNRGVRTKTWT